MLEGRDVRRWRWDEVALLKHLSAEYRPAVRALIESLARDCGVQIIMVTHSRELVCGNTVVIE